MDLSFSFTLTICSFQSSFFLTLPAVLPRPHPPDQFNNMACLHGAVVSMFSWKSSGQGSIPCWADGAQPTLLYTLSLGLVDKWAPGEI